jgi:negative regulator of sigma E activity
MKESSNEFLSGLMDGEAGYGEAAALSRLIEDEEARRTWARYHLIADCMRGQLPRAIDRNFGDRLAIALKMEPAILAPAPSVVRSMLKPAAGFAIAASVAAAAILGIQYNRAVDVAPIGAQPAVAQVQQVPAAAERISLASGAPVSARPVPQPAAGRAGSQLNRYLVNHNEYRSNIAVQGMLPYVRIVSHGDEE